jgi:excisionase family DNA binding protein
MLGKNDETRMLTPKEVSTILGVHQKTVHTWLRAGKLVGVKISYRAWRIPKEALDQFIEENQNIRHNPHEGIDQNKSPNKEFTSGILQKSAGTSTPQVAMKQYIRDIMGEHPVNQDDTNK